MKILILEDDHSAAEVLAIRLGRLDCETMVAATVAEARKMALHEQPDVVMVDFKVQGDRNAGAEFIAELRDNPETAGIKTIVHSIYIHRPVDLPPQAGEPFGLLRKPFQRNELSDLIAAARSAKDAANG